MKEEPPVKIHTDKSGTAIGLLEAEKRFRRIKSYQEILLLKERLKSVAHSAEVISIFCFGPPTII